MTDVGGKVVRHYEWDGIDPAFAPDRRRSHKVSVSKGFQERVLVENEIWWVLRRIANHEGLSIAELVLRLDLGRTGSLSNQLRVFVVRYLWDELGERLEKRRVKR